MTEIIDLHIHSTYSDGTLSPFEIIDTAKINGVTTISITDHDTINAYNQELFDYAKKQNITIIPGVEISTKYKKAGIHVLGYNINLNNELLLKTLKMLKNSRLDYLTNVAKSLNRLGYILNTAELKELPTVTKAHIAKDILNNNKNKNLLIKNFNHIPSMGEFIETIMNEGCPAYVEKFSISPIEAGKIIKQANGKVIMAHPVAYTYEDNLSIEQIDNIIKEMNVDGIEANYLYIDRYKTMHNDSIIWNKYAKENNLLATIGSDFHSFDNLHPEIGFINTSFKISTSEIASILDKLLNN